MKRTYEIVDLPEMTVAGIHVRTSNTAPDMGEAIGGLWQRFYGQGVYESIAQKVDAKSIGLYTNYAGDFLGEYDLYTCCAVGGKEQPAGVEVVTIPAGRYAKFVVKGDVQKDVGAFWGDVWQMEELDRSYTGDFEEYQPGESMTEAEVHIYIALK